ncbi:hypothetical protein, partial [Pedobacter sp. Hv1]|uniref:hypothetical protein n=1 Tax=Pedobacter sp. Hv1 TaxID=1740090 RepID=UPI000A51BC0D
MKKSYFKRFFLKYLLVLIALVLPRMLTAQTTETFEASTVGQASFTNGTKTFNLTSNYLGFKVVNIAGLGYNFSNRFIQADDAANGDSMGQICKITDASGTFKVSSLFIYLTGSATQNPNVTLNGQPGSVTFIGKLGGVTQFTIVKNTAGTNIGFTAPNNGFIPVNFATDGVSNFTGIAIDQLEIQLSSNYDYLAIDNFTFQDAALAAVITGNPPNRTICAAGSTTFAMTANNATGYQWQVNTGSGFVDISNGGVYSNATTSTLTITGATGGMNGYTYRCRAISAGGNANTNIATLTVSAITVTSTSKTDI